MSTPTFNIAVVADHPIIFKGLESIMNARGIELVFGALGKKDFFEKMGSSPVKPDLVFIDISFRQGEPDGFETLNEIKRDYPKLKTVIYSAYSENHYITRSLDSIKKIIDGMLAIGPGMKITKNLYPFKKNKNKTGKKELTCKQEEVMIHICNDFSRKEIADKMNVSIKTIDSHCSNIFLKTGVRSAAGLVAYAAKNGLIAIQMP